MSAPSVAPPVRRARRWPWITAAVVLVVLAVAAIAGDALAREYAGQYVRERVIAALGLDPGTPVGVELGGGSILLQALAGRIDSVDVTIERLEVGELAGEASMHAEGVPLDPAAATRLLDLRVRIDEAAVGVLADRLSGIPLETVELEEPEIVATTALSVLGARLPVGMGLVPSAEEGRLVFTPTSIRVGEESFTVEELRASVLGPLAAGLLQQQSFCVAEHLPEALRLADVAVEGAALAIRVEGDGAALGGPGLQSPGRCEGS